MPGNNVTEEMVRVALDAYQNAEGSPLEGPPDVCMRAALEAALADHVVVPTAEQVELIRICNSAEHDAKYAARRLGGHSMQHNVEVLACTFRLIREKIKGHIAATPPVKKG